MLLTERLFVFFILFPLSSRLVALNLANGNPLFREKLRQKLEATGGINCHVEEEIAQAGERVRNSLLCVRVLQQLCLTGDFVLSVATTICRRTTERLRASHLVSGGAAAKNWEALAKLSQRTARSFGVVSAANSRYWSMISTP
jgi:hypothetical protein